MRFANLTLRFFLELCAFGGLAYWGAELDASIVVKVVAAVGAPALAIGVWGRWIAPKASARLADPARLAAESGVFAAAALALLASASAGVALAFAALVIGNEILLAVWGQRETA